MKIILIGSLLICALAATTANASPGSARIDRETAMLAPVEELARAALSAASSHFVEVERPNFSGLSGPDAPLSGLRFATAAESAGYPGLCKATTAWISVGPSLPPIETTLVYKVVGDLKPLPDMWNEAYGAELEKKCAAAGRVLPTESADFGQARFFTVSKGSDDYVWYASRALQVAIANASTGLSVVCISEPDIDSELIIDRPADDPEVIERRENREGCANAAATLASLSPERLLDMEVAPCSETKPQRYCLTAYVLRYAYGNHQALWQVGLQYQVGLGDNRDVTNVDAVSLAPSYSVYD